ncbi:MAG: HAMP domain-containing histidine kinase [Clostridia bacterium]|nr:HAMP domain-containing histidine kinase [Clostridia bacterium]
MKMRFWQKTYIFTLILFLFCINIGVLSLTVYTHSKNVQSAEATASAEQYYVAMSFERDYSDLMEMNQNASPTLLMQTFGSHYKSKGIMLSFNKNGSTLYKNYTESIESPTDSLLHTEINGDRHIIISASVCNGEYELVFGKNVSSVDDEFKSLMITYVITALAVSIILAVCLYFILKKLSTPLERLRNTTEIIESGDFSVRATEQGSDEFTLLARSFNAMLDKINEQFETLERDAKRKQMLVDNMAHELRTPLTSIHGYAEFLEKAATTEEKRIIAAKYIMSESERLQKISEILLDSAYIRGNELKKDETDIASIFYDVSEKLQFKAKDFNAEIILDTEKTIVSGNETLLSMLFYNLTENAIKACTDGGKITLSCRDGKAVIEDNGKGMTEEQLLHITEPFYRTDKSRSRAEGGAGLGLALCKQIADSHNASINFESALGKGTKVVIDFTTRQ